MGQSPPRQRGRVKSMGDGIAVSLNVYNLQHTEDQGKRSLNGSLGFGIYHSGVVMLDSEVSFGGHPEADASDVGIFVVPPRSILPPNRLAETRVLGHIPRNVTWNRIASILRSMQADWLAQSYHLLSHNCNHFCAALCKELSSAFDVEISFPSYVNRAARFADKVVPTALYRSMMRNSIPPQAPEPRQTSPKRKMRTDAPPPPRGGTRADFEAMTIAQLRSVMNDRGVSMHGVIEKGDMVNAILEHQKRSR